MNFKLAHMVAIVFLMKLFPISLWMATSCLSLVLELAQPRSIGLGIIEDYSLLDRSTHPCCLPYSCLDLGNHTCSHTSTSSDDLSSPNIPLQSLKFLTMLAAFLMLSWLGCSKLVGLLSCHLAAAYTMVSGCAFHREYLPFIVPASIHFCFKLVETAHRCLSPSTRAG